MPRFSANLTFLFDELPFVARFSAAAAAGFDAVEFSFPYEHDPGELAKAAQNAGVEVALFNTPPGDPGRGEFGLAVLPGRERDAQAGVAVALEYAQILGCHRIHVMSGVAEAADPAAHATYRRNLAEACRAAAEAGVDVLIEPLNPCSRPGYFLSDFPAAEALIADLGCTNLKLMFDIFHRQILHGDVTRALKRLLPCIGHVQVASVPDRHEPDTGELADSRIFSMLDQLGYDGLVGAEYHPRAGAAAGLGWFKRYARR